MTVRSSDLGVFLYNLGVAATGAYAARELGIDDRWTLFGILFVFALLWTAYFRFEMRGQLIALEATPEED